ncbi:PilW family protein [Uliginosibacterium aquaticum]|uniref:PilW family protein n=1 Tax=Uliginosibacterium aquaticum TaxID=2731212 RepID=A0ABX2IFV2_9RHOO|nr:PilW family protein [Uliginosibacterium aquaticum]NSL55636.1 PilW family protein [Uliginosibacterium aquaticum]
MSRAPSLHQRGLTLIELMVAIVIASLLVLAVSSVMIGFEARKRSATSVNDINQAGNYAAYVLDHWLRSAGSGFSQSAEYAFGCTLQASNGSQNLPRTAALPAPFASLGTTFRLAPLLILADGSTPATSGSSSDVLLVMSGAAGRSEAPAYLTDYPSSSSLTLKNTLAFAASDLLLLTDQEAKNGGIAPCLVSQVSSSFSESGAGSLALAGTYYAAEINSVSVAGFTKNAVAFNLGNVASSNPPAFQVLGVGDNNTLYAYDLLQTSANPLQAVANGLFELHALYGLDSNADGKVDSWVKPSGSYAFSALSDGSSTANGLLSTIKAIRVGLILRTDVAEKTAVSTSSLTLFSDLGSSLQFTRSLTASEQKYRYRTLEISVPLRNAMMLE